MPGIEAMLQLVKNAVADLITRTKGLDDIHDDLVTVDTVVDAIKAKTDTLVNQFSKYSYSGSLASLATYVPPDKTIVMSAYLAGTIGKLYVMFSTSTILEAGTNFSGLVGAIYCDGTNIGFKNSDSGGSHTLTLYGLTLA
jgi:hypothetical protein